MTKTNGKHTNSDEIIQSSQFLHRIRQSTAPLIETNVGKACQA